MESLYLSYSWLLSRWHALCGAREADPQMQSRGTAQNETAERVPHTERQNRHFTPRPDRRSGLTVTIGVETPGTACPPQLRNQRYTNCGRTPATIVDRVGPSVPPRDDPGPRKVQVPGTFRFLWKTYMSREMSPMLIAENIGNSSQLNCSPRSKKNKTLRAAQEAMSPRMTFFTGDPY